MSKQVPAHTGQHAVNNQQIVYEAAGIPQHHELGRSQLTQRTSFAVAPIRRGFICHVGK